MRVSRFCFIEVGLYQRKCCLRCQLLHNLSRQHTHKHTHRENMCLPEGEQTAFKRWRQAASCWQEVCVCVCTPGCVGGHHRHLWHLRLVYRWHINHRGWKQFRCQMVQRGMRFNLEKREDLICPCAGWVRFWWQDLQDQEEPFPLYFPLLVGKTWRLLNHHKLQTAWGDVYHVEIHPVLDWGTTWRWNRDSYVNLGCCFVGNTSPAWTTFTAEFRWRWLVGGGRVKSRTFTPGLVFW